jgi:hypothetical protein
MFDPFKQSKLQNAYQSMKEYKSTPEKDMTIDELKRLSGTDLASKKAAATVQANKAQYMYENNIKPGTKEWFKLWFAQPDITGENPFGK